MTKPWRPASPRPTEAPLHEWISKALADDIATGRLQPGDPLPAQRDLADALRVALGTVTRAYAAARERGLVVGQRRRGTVVAPDRAVDNPLASLLSVPSSAIDLAANLPIYSADPDPSPALRAIASRPDVRQLLRYPPTAGLLRHRAAGAAWLQRQQVPVNADDVIVCGGGQHGIFVALAAHTRPGDTVLVESFTYPGTLAAAQTLGLKVHGVDMDEHGLIPEALARAYATTGAEVLYCIPTIQNPTTISLSEARKRQIADIVKKQRGVVIEDEIHRPLVAQPTTPLYALAPEHTIFMTAPSKAVAGSLRTGLLAAAPPRHAALLSTLQASAFAVCPLGAELFATWLEDGTVTRTIRKKRKEASQRIRATKRALGKVRGLRIQADPNGYLVWLTLPEGLSATHLATAAENRDIRLLAGSAFRGTPDDADNTVRLAVGAAEHGQALDTALAELKTLLQEGHLAPGVF